MPASPQSPGAAAPRPTGGGGGGGVCLARVCVATKSVRAAGIPSYFAPCNWPIRLCHASLKEQFVTMVPCIPKLVVSRQCSHARVGSIVRAQRHDANAWPPRCVREGGPCQTWFETHLRAGCFSVDSSGQAARSQSKCDLIN